MKIKRLLIVLILSTFYFLLVTSSVRAIFEERPSSARAWGMGGAFTAVADDSSAIYFNPAGLAQLEMMELSGTYTMLYREKDLEYKLGSFALPMGRLGTIGLSGNTYGHGKIIEDTYIFSAGRKFTFENRDLYLGGNAKYLRLEIETVGKEFDYGGDLGLLYKLLDGKLSLGLFGGNINTPHIGEDLSQRYAAGVAYRPGPDLILAADYHREKQEEEENDEFRLGVEYHWLKYLFLRSGVANNPGRWMVGWGLKNRFLSFDYAYLPHHNLDKTHLGTLTFRFGGPRKPKEVKLPEPVLIFEEEVEVPVKAERVVKKININTASRVQLKTLSGIGPTKALAIITHRPYERIEELRSVPGIGAERYETLKDLITIGPEKKPLKTERARKKVNINTAPLEELVTLPGMSTKRVQTIIAYREKHGPFKTIEGLFYVPEMKVKTFLKIEDLITVGPEKIEKLEAVPTPKREVEIIELIPSQFKEITHTVVKGDTLSKIAQRYLGDTKRYKEIIEYNGIKDPDLIQLGDMIKILIEVKE